jgi:lipoate-protein ligase A
MMDSWRWIDTGSDAGEAQMATDWAVLEHAGTLGIPTFRVYAWIPSCISLGYNQSADSIDCQRCRQENVDLVRRPTGGRAVLHAQEVTYSVVVPRNSPFYTSSVGELYSRISRGLARGIRHLGVPASLEKRTLDIRSHYRNPDSVSCFSAAARSEVLVDGKKLVGSAQRHLSWGILQHGSILTGDAHLELPRFVRGMDEEGRERLRRIMERKTVSVGGYLGREADYAEVAEAVRRGVEEEMGIAFQDGALTQEEAAAIPGLKARFRVEPGPDGDPMEDMAGVKTMFPVQGG